MASPLIRSILLLCLAAPAMALSGDQQTTAQADEPTSRDLMCRKAICLQTYVSGPPTRGRGPTWKAPEPSITSITRCRTEVSLPPRKPCQFL